MTAQRLPSLPRRLRVLATELLALPRQQLAEPLIETRKDEYHEATIILRPLGAPAPPGAPLPGEWFSPTEKLIWDALGVGTLRGRDLAKAVGEEYGGRLRMILSNLVDRGCIVSGRLGYARAEPWKEEDQRARH